MADTMTVSKAIETLNQIAAAKRIKVTKSDKELAEEAKKATEAIAKAASDKAAAEQAKAAQEAADLEKLKQEELHKRDANFPPPKGGFDMADLKKRGQSAYKTLIAKRAGEDKVLKAFHEWNDDVLLASVCLQKSPEHILKSVPEFREFLEEELSKHSSELAKAMAAATAGFGQEWIPELWSPDLIDLIRVERVVAGMFRRFNMRAPTVHISTLVSEFKAFVVAESTGNTPYAIPAIVSDAGTGTVLMTAIELAVASIFSKTFEEDSIIPALPEIRRRVIEGMSKGVEDAIINGSTLATHPDSDVTSGDAATAWFGLRFVTAPSVPPTVSLDGVNMTATNVLRLKLLQGRFGARDADSIWITSPQGLVKLLGLQDTSGAQILLTIDRFGPRAVLNTGSVASLFGRDVVVSDLVKTNEDATGVVPAMPGDRTELINAHKNTFMIGDRRMLSIESDSAPLTRQRILVATIREVFQRIKPSQDTAKDFPVTRGLNIETV